MIIMKIILLVVLIVLIGTLVLYNNKETFSGAYMTIVDPYSIPLHKDISEKADWWNYLHNQKLYYYRDYVDMKYKE